MKKHKQLKQERQLKMLHGLDALFLNIEINDLTLEYVVYSRLKAHDSVPITLFLNILDYKRPRENLDLEGIYISNTLCVNDIDYETAILDFFSYKMHRIFSHVYPKCEINANDHSYPYPTSMQNYFRDLTELFKKVVFSSCNLNCYDPVPRINTSTEYEKNLAKIAAHNPIQQKEAAFIFNLLSSAICFVTEEFNQRFHTQLKIMKTQNELYL